MVCVSVWVCVCVGRMISTARHLRLPPLPIIPEFETWEKPGKKLSNITARHCPWKIEI